MDDSSPTPGHAQDHVLGVQRLFVRHQQQVRAFVVALVADFTIADDVMQEDLPEVTRQAPSFEIGSNFMAWARTIARFRVLSAVRDRQRLPRRLADDVIDALAADAPLDELDELIGRSRAPQLPRSARPGGARDGASPLWQRTPPPGHRAVRAQSVNAINVTLARARAALRECMERGLRAGGARP